VEKMDRGLKVGENRGENAGSKVQSPISGTWITLGVKTREKK